MRHKHILAIRPRSCDLSDFVFRHSVLLELYLVNKEPSACLFGNQTHQQNPPVNTKSKIHREGKSFKTVHFVVTSDVVESS